MEGLESSEAKLSELERTKRVDAEFFNPHGLNVVKRLQEIDAVSLASMVGVSDGNHFSISDEFVDDGVPYFRGQDVTGSFFMEQACPVTIPPEVYDQKHMKRSHLAKGDVLLSIVGTIGESALFSSSQPATCSCKLAILRPESIPSEFLAVFLKAEHGRLQIIRQTRGAIQGSLLLEDMDQILVPRFSKDFEGGIVKMVRLAQLTLEKAANCQAAAEQTLLQDLGLKNWQPPEPLTYTRRASEALAAERFDSEYFQPKFAALITKMKKGGEVVRLGDCLRFCERGRQPAYAEEGLPVINSRHVRTNNVVLDEDNRFATEDAAQLKLDEENRFTIKQGDLLINGTGVGTMGRCAPYLREGKALPDNHVTILRMKPEAGIDPVFLSIQLNSIIGQMQVDQYFKGSSGQIELYPGDIKEFRIWRAPQQIQQQIKANLDQAHAARQQAQALLAKAKRAVEVAIEEGEAKAMKFLAT